MMSKLNWIKCSDRLPEEGVAVYACHNYDNIQCIALHDKERGWIFGGHKIGKRYEINNFTHWAEIDWPEDE